MTSNSGGDGGGPTLETRVAKIEATLGHVQADVAEVKLILRGHESKFDSLRDRVESGYDDTRDQFNAQRDRLDGLRDRMERDFRILFGAIIAVALGLAGLMAKGFHWL